jgi:hypothetical protein
MSLRGIYRCNNGHLFERSYLSLLFVPHLGWGRAYAKCPIDGKRSVITQVKRDGLTEAEIAKVTSRPKK